MTDGDDLRSRWEPDAHRRGLDEEIPLDGRTVIRDGSVIYTIPEDKATFLDDYRTDAIVHKVVNETLRRWDGYDVHPLAVSGLWAEYRGEEIGGPTEWFGWLGVDDE